MTGSSWTARLRTAVDDWRRRREIASHAHTMYILGKPARNRTSW